MPLKKSSISLLLFFSLFSGTVPARHSKQAAPFTIMINPSGDAKNSGRRIEDSFERGITIQYAEQLKQELEQLVPILSVIITRSPGEIVYPLQNANFANRLKVNLYIDLNFFHEKETKPRLYIYQFSYNDSFITKSFDLSFIPYDQAHRTHFSQTSRYTELIKNKLTHQAYQKYFDVRGPYQLPFAPLIGIQEPAIGLEMGIKQKADWKTYINPLAQSIVALIEESGKAYV